MTLIIKRLKCCKSTVLDFSDRKKTRNCHKNRIVDITWITRARYPNNDIMQWPNEKREKDKSWSPKYYRQNYRLSKTNLSKEVGELMWYGMVDSYPLYQYECLLHFFLNTINLIDSYISTSILSRNDLIGWTFHKEVMSKDVPCTSYHFARLYTDIVNEYFATFAHT
jgi:hypothetical protein